MTFYFTALEIIIKIKYWFALTSVVTRKKNVAGAEQSCVLSSMSVVEHGSFHIHG